MIIGGITMVPPIKEGLPYIFLAKLTIKMITPLH